MKIVPCIAWVPRGIPSMKPQKVKLSNDDMRRLLQGATAVSAESSESDAAMTSDLPTHHRQGLRGSEKKTQDNGSSNESDDEDADKRYGLANYDDEEDEQSDGHLKGLTVFPTNEDDPYIASHDSDDDDEDFKLKQDDNLLLVGRVIEDDFGLEVHVYNESEGSFYVHHDYPLDRPSICIESIHYDPGSEQQGGNLCAVGCLSPIIQLWDLDIVECVEPIAILGSADDKTNVKRKKGKQKTVPQHEEGETSVEPKKKKKKGISHTEAVLDLAWNRQKQHILASGSADNTIILWDLDIAQGANVLEGHNDKVQALKWHPVEDNLLLSGGCDGLVNLWDCRQCSSQRKWSISNGEIEKIQWNHWDPFRFLVTTDSGAIINIDSRQEAILNENRLENAHKGAISGLALHPTANGCVATCGVDGIVKIWHLDNSGQTPLRMVAKKKLKLGKLFCCSFCPDNPWLLAIGGESEDGIYLWDIRKDEKVATEFNVNSRDTYEHQGPDGDGSEDGRDSDDRESDD